jgi:transcriptional regulator with XRE-family HTH domain
VQQSSADYDERPIGGAAASADGEADLAFGALLKERRAAAGLTQAALGKLAGVHQSYINRLESGEREPPDRALVVRLADALRLDEPGRQRLLRAAGHVPDWLLTLPADDPTVLSVARFLAAEEVSEEAKAEFRLVVEVMLTRWRVE